MAAPDRAVILCRRGKPEVSVHSFLGQLVCRDAGGGRECRPVKGAGRQFVAGVAGRRVLSLGLDYANERRPVTPEYADEAQLLAAMRYLLERTLDLPFGSLTIIRAEVLRGVLQEAAAIAKTARQNAGDGAEGSQLSLF